MSSDVVSDKGSERSRGIPVLSFLGDRLLAAVQIGVLSLLGFVGACAAAAVLLAVIPVAAFLMASTVGTGPTHLPAFVWFAAFFVIVALPITLAGPRLIAWLTRMLVGRWCGMPIASPYRTYAEHCTARRSPGLNGRLGWLLCDPATWRDLLWNLVVGTTVFAVSTVPAGLVRVGVDLLLGYHANPTVDLFNPQTRARAPFAAQVDYWMDSNFQLGCLTLAIAALCASLLLSRRLLAGYGQFARVLLGPTKQAELAQRVRHLAETRSATLDTGAAAMRRIERDLHDGAQARLVATGMTLGAAEALIDSNPEAARALLIEAKESSARALAELRDLVRGIHPPVLADRGLVEALQALALDLPLKVTVAGGLPGRPPAPVESAAYFASSELLANVVKHARAGQAWLDVRHTGGALRIGVTDDGRGGADPAKGSGLRGVEQRLAAFDGILAVSSPPGGPTVVNLEIPCTLSSPKTSTS